MKLPITKKDDNNKNSGQALTPFEQSMMGLQNTMNRLFDDAWFRFPTFADHSLASSNSSGWWPKVDISETDKAIKIKMNVPNVDPDKVNIEVDADSLVISGSTLKEEEEKEENFVRIEREEGSFQRVFNLPNGCDTENIQANSKHGTLFITIPKKPEAQKKKVSINVQS